MQVQSDELPQVPVFLIEALKNLGLGLRLMFFLRPAATPRLDWGQVLLLLALILLAPLVLDFAKVGIAGNFVPEAMPYALFIAPLLVLAAWALTRLDAGSETMPQALDTPAAAPSSAATEALLMALFCLALPMAVLELLLHQVMDDSGEAVFGNAWTEVDFASAYFVPLWTALAAAVAAIRLQALPRRRWAVAVLVAIACLVVPQIGAIRYPLWSAPPEDNAAREARYYALASEDVFYHQPLLLDEAIEAVKPGQRGQVELYFVGAAGYADEDVFMNEVDTVEKLFSKRFAATGHSVKLVNNPATVHNAPIASATSLQIVLEEMAKRMNRDEDILFLFLTSHGSADHKFALDFGAFRFNDLDPPTLRRILDGSGIKRRVVVVSACYSGGFVDALKDDNTLVITAASADRSSFGCGSRSDITWFGRAFFDEALRETTSFTEAFKLAEPRIAEREKKQGYKPSQPQMSLGKDIAPVLDAFAAARKGEAEERKVERERKAAEKQKAADSETKAAAASGKGK